MFSVPPMPPMHSWTYTLNTYSTVLNHATRMRNILNMFIGVKGSIRIHSCENSINVAAVTSNVNSSTLCPFRCAGILPSNYQPQLFQIAGCNTMPPTTSVTTGGLAVYAGGCGDSWFPRDTMVEIEVPDYSGTMFRSAAPLDHVFDVSKVDGNNYCPYVQFLNSNTASTAPVQKFVIAYSGGEDFYPVFFWGPLLVDIS